ncbi:phage holin family protein [Capnocytophaga catalasegens]|uniref:Membrane protein n=1 Tax=Capnocytophaga catalasegens TaxID=1004260 RepID=A0AAV5AZH8_9FLAO|nr:phage holin family protein [Capnocytophaga catalasegens]GIZ16140.1 membrane protein [Capnocytophaga catalasegens]GJM50916.1 membrane protein [Capnocytophaga catalasegens]GJM53760.1 membrane protein [Capnocytophaga catalasegens]
MKYILNLLIIGLVVFGLSFVLKGVYVDDYLSAVVFAFVLSILNVFLRPILVFLSFPITIITLGLFLLVINTILILLADKLLDGFAVSGFWYALLLSLCISAVQSLIDGREEAR